MPCEPLPWTPWKRPNPVIRACRWAWPTSPKCCGTTSCSFNPANPKWFNRDRFVLSNGHGSMLQYALLHLSGFDLPMDQLKRFRQLHSKTAGHPEASETPGVETTTGPLGQGLANAVGFALAEKVLAAHFNRPGHDVVDHHTYVFLGDGCLMEGISHEVASLAGTWQLGKLVAIYDDNGISIDGEVHGWFTDDTPARFEAYGWNVIRGVDGHDAEAIRQAHRQRHRATRQAHPDLRQDHHRFRRTEQAGQGRESRRARWARTRSPPPVRSWAGSTRRSRFPPRFMPAGITRPRVSPREQGWNDAFAKYAAAHPELAAEFKRRLAGELPADWAEKSQAYIAKLQAEGPEVASRKASQMSLDAFGPLLPELIGGSADLAGSNLTKWKGSLDAATGNSADGKGNYVYYGVREFGMTAIANGLALHGGFIPYDATFLVFSDYARNAVRMSALIPAHAIHVYTHDSIGLGEDGPTHQPVEHMAVLALHPEQPAVAPVRRGGVGRVVEGGDRAQGRAVVPDLLAAEPQASAA